MIDKSTSFTITGNDYRLCDKEENEFTEEDIQSAIIIAYNAGKENKSENKANEFIMKHLRPLTLPKSITTNDELEIISVSW